MSPEFSNFFIPLASPIIPSNQLPLRINRLIELGLILSGLLVDYPCSLPQIFWFCLKISLDRFGKIFMNMPSVGNLNGIGSALPRSISIGIGSVTTDDFDTGMLFEPGSQGLSLTIRQQVDDPMFLKIHQDCAVTLPFSFRPVIHAENLWSGQIRLRSGPDSPQKGVGADIDPGLIRRFLSGLSSNGQAEMANSMA